MSMGDEGARRLRVLVADDDARTRMFLGDVLEALGHHVIIAANGTDALNYLASEVLDLVVTDLDMPGANGWEVIDRAKARNPGLPVLLITGWGDVACNAPGRTPPDAIVAKPVSVPCLETVIGRTLARAS